MRFIIMVVPHGIQTQNFHNTEPATVYSSYSINCQITISYQDPYVYMNTRILLSITVLYMLLPMDLAFCEFTDRLTQNRKVDTPMNFSY